MLAPNHHRHLRRWSIEHGGLFSMRVAHRRMLVASDARLVHLLFGAGEGLDKCLEPSLGNKMISQKVGRGERREERDEREARARVRARATGSAADPPPPSSSPATTPCSLTAPTPPTGAWSAKGRPPRSS